MGPQSPQERCRSGGSTGPGRAWPPGPADCPHCGEGHGHTEPPADQARDPSRLRRRRNQKRMCTGEGGRAPVLKFTVPGKARWCPASSPSSLPGPSSLRRTPAPGLAAAARPQPDSTSPLPRPPPLYTVKNHGMNGRNLSRPQGLSSERNSENSTQTCRLDAHAFFPLEIQEPES